MYIFTQCIVIFTLEVIIHRARCKYFALTSFLVVLFQLFYNEQCLLGPIFGTIPGSIQPLEVLKVYFVPVKKTPEHSLYQVLTKQIKTLISLHTDFLD